MTTRQHSTDNGGGLVKKYRSVLVGLATALVAAVPAQAATTLPAANSRLKATACSGLIDDLDAALPNVGVPTVVGDGDRVATTCSPAAANRLAAFCREALGARRPRLGVLSGQGRRAPGTDHTHRS